MICQPPLRSLDHFGHYLRKLYRLRRTRTPIRRTAPVNIGAVSALVSTTISTPYQEAPRGDVEAVRVDLPIGFNVIKRTQNCTSF